ncbi:MAG: cell wall hydrolase [Clostridia bacterium]|nr:cell wall hydrolase [Clostridia bacterium]
MPLEGLSKALGIAWKVEKDGHVSLSGNYRPILQGEAFYREDEVYWLSKIISAESKGEPLLGQIAVGCVILNRVKSPLFPSTIYSVIFDKKYGVQFTPTANGTIYQKPYDISVIAAKICLEGYDMGNILYFYHPVSSASTNWISQNRKFAFTIGGHRFYY